MVTVFLRVIWPPQRTSAFCLLWLEVVAPSVEFAFLRNEPELRCEAPGTARFLALLRVFFLRGSRVALLTREPLSSFGGVPLPPPPFRDSAIFSFASTETSRCRVCPLPRLPQSLTCGETVRGRGRSIFGLHVPTAPPPSTTHSAFSLGSCCALLIDFCYPFPRLRVTTKRRLLSRFISSPSAGTNTASISKLARSFCISRRRGGGVGRGSGGVLVAFSQAPAAFTAAGSRRAPPRPLRRHFDVARRAASSSSPRLFVFARALLSQPRLLPVPSRPGQQHLPARRLGVRTAILPPPVRARPPRPTL